MEHNRFLHAALRMIALAYRLRNGFAVAALAVSSALAAFIWTFNFGGTTKVLEKITPLNDSQVFWIVVIGLGAMTVLLSLPLLLASLSAIRGGAPTKEATPVTLEGEKQANTSKDTLLEEDPIPITVVPPDMEMRLLDVLVRIYDDLDQDRFFLPPRIVDGLDDSALKTVLQASRFICMDTLPKNASSAYFFFRKHVINCCSPAEYPTVWHHLLSSLEQNVTAPRNDSVMRLSATEVEHMATVLPTHNGSENQLVRFADVYIDVLRACRNRPDMASANTIKRVGVLAQLPEKMRHAFGITVQLVKSEPVKLGGAIIDVLFGLGDKVFELDQRDLHALISDPSFCAHNTTFYEQLLGGKVFASFREDKVNGRVWDRKPLPIGTCVRCSFSKQECNPYGECFCDIGGLYPPGEISFKGFYAPYCTAHCGTKIDRITIDIPGRPKHGVNLKSLSGHVVDTHPDSDWLTQGKPGRGFLIHTMNEDDRRNLYGYLHASR